MAGAALVSTIAAVGVPSASASATTTTALPRACPSAQIVQSTLGRKVTKVGSVRVSTSAGEKAKGCGYKTSYKTPTVVVFGTPVSAAKFAASRRIESKRARVVTVRGLGNEAWALKGGGGLAVLKGNLEIVISAPRTSDRQLEALARIAIRALPRS